MYFSQAFAHDCAEGTFSLSVLTSASGKKYFYGFSRLTKNLWINSVAASILATKSGGSGEDMNLELSFFSNMNLSNISM